MNDIADFKDKSERNVRVQARYDQLMAEGKHGHYETMFRVVREEVARAVAAETARCITAAQWFRNVEHYTVDDVAERIRAASR
jgi:hypothetical protein